MEEDSKSGGEGREQALERVLRQVLKQRRSRSAGECPEPDILAAYFEHALDATETSRWEAHFSSCSGCQQALAALARSATAEVAEVQQAVQVARAAREADQQRRPRHYFGWRWLAPAAAVAAAAAIWFALRPALFWKPATPTQVSQQSAPRAQTAESVAPALTAQKEELAEPRARAASASGKPAETSPGAAAANAPAEAKKKAHSVAPKAEAPKIRSEEAQTALAKPAEPAPGKIVSGNVGGVVGGVATPARSDQFAAAPLGEKSAESKTGVAAPNVAPAAAPEATSGAIGMLRRQARAEMAAQRIVAGPRGAVVVSSPSHNVLWRIGAGRKIERSLDAGRTWQAQASPTEADLTAGSAPLDTVCWVVGRAGTILRTTDGEHWKRIASPLPAGAAAPLDWIEVRAHDAQTATVLSATGQRFATSDGGKTWQAQ